MIDLAFVKAIEQHAFRAWPALDSVTSGGWLFRFSQGYTKRANSANAVDPAAPFADILREAESRYASRQLPVIFRISPLAGSAPDLHLDRLAFRRIDETLVMTAPLSPGPPADASVVLASMPDERWSAGFAQAHGILAHRRRTHDQILAAIEPPAAYALLWEGERPIAFGLAVLEQEMIGLFDIVTVRDQRRRGAATRLTATLLDWGARHGARQAYLQVTEQNRGARRLYEQLGFHEAYRYHYRLPP